MTPLFFCVVLCNVKRFLHNVKLCYHKVTKRQNVNVNITIDIDWILGVFLDAARENKNRKKG